MTLHVIYHCNQWQEYSSFRFIGVVDTDHLEPSLKKIKKQCGYTNEDMDKYIFVEIVALNDLDI